VKDSPIRVDLNLVDLDGTVI